MPYLVSSKKKSAQIRNFTKINYFSKVLKFKYVWQRNCGKIKHDFKYTGGKEKKWKKDYIKFKFCKILLDFPLTQNSFSFKVPFLLRFKIKTKEKEHGKDSLKMQ